MHITNKVVAIAVIFWAGIFFALIALNDKHSSTDGTVLTPSKTYAYQIEDGTWYMLKGSCTWADNGESGIQITCRKENGIGTLRHASETVIQARWILPIENVHITIDAGSIKKNQGE
jgi:hypothetical protein